MKIRSKIILAVAISAIIILVVNTSFSQSQPKHYMVKLYAADKVVATWDALDWGTFDGQSLVFTVGDRHNPKRVRISGTFSVEESD